ncbi:MAG: DNA polymerase III subunit epsilon [Gammaproteobacteria bacterium]|nr:DNA polymerase III subunit epsilon [Gammaproteobacteria bacterium]MBU1645283.1 DNA polymerase III subunit epsilon [Gammaproteobacteria bacterium]MBU1971620.1 DNA polymerase III subunit epsilon [Gammaproteobacteria bacterium]
MTRQIMLDTETTGLDPSLGHRIIEIGCVEMLGRRLTGQRFHRYINPERDIDAGAMQVHGITNERVAGEPVFGAIAAELVDFIRGAELVIHNAAFDVGFLNHEFALLGLDPVAGICDSVIDTLRMAREMRPGRKNNLDALCRDFGVDNSGRQLHGALLDAELLSEVYLAMTRGQESLIMDLEPAAVAGSHATVGDRPALLVLRASAEELAEHERVLGEIAQESRGKCLWQTQAAG